MRYGRKDFDLKVARSLSTKGEVSATQNLSAWVRTSSQTYLSGENRPKGLPGEF